jgi:excisionase family DNA binding protein
VPLVPVASAILDLFAGIRERSEVFVDIGQLLSVKEAATLLGVGRTTLHGLIAAGAIKSVKINRRRLIKEEEVASFIDSLAKKAAEDAASEAHTIRRFG